MPVARATEKMGRWRDNQAQNRPAGAEGEVRKFPNEPTGTCGFWRDSGEKKPTETGWFFNYWWWGGIPVPLLAEVNLTTGIVQLMKIVESC